MKLFCTIALLAGIATIAPEAAAPPTYVDAAWFGARADGSDAGPAIRQALAAVALDGVVRVPDGELTLGPSHDPIAPDRFPDGSPEYSALVVRQRVTILCGWDRKTIWRLAPHTKMRILTATEPVRIIECVADGNKANRDGSVPFPGGDVVSALFKVGPESEVIGCELRNGIEDGCGAWNVPNVWYLGCWSHDNGTPKAGAVGLAIGGPQNVDSMIEGCYCEGNSAAGIWLSYGCNNATVQNNIIDGNGRAGVSLMGMPMATPGNQNLVIHNRITGNNGPAVNCWLEQNGGVVENYFSGNAAGVVLANNCMGMTTTGNVGQ
jgi:parallel beta-helix repeat protein